MQRWVVIAAVTAACGRAPAEPHAPIANTAPRAPEDRCADRIPPQPPLILGAPCDDHGCNAGSRILLEAAAGRWPHGSYRFTVTADGRRSTCTGVIPFRSCDTNDDDPVCTGDAVARIEIANCGTPEVEFSQIELIDYPCRADVTIERDGAFVAEATFWPVYSWFEPSGTGCEPQCLQGKSELPVY